ncbi:uncharacterized protein [Dermacentor andersoni]|uniref:uncharacterized protein isoform X1 n=1 Tax=Dermacentor andersoni TaxID=34620 RepID=UPI003B3A82B8
MSAPGGPACKRTWYVECVITSCGQHTCNMRCCLRVCARTVAREIRMALVALFTHERGPYSRSQYLFCTGRRSLLQFYSNRKQGFRGLCPHIVCVIVVGLALSTFDLRGHAAAAEKSIGDILREGGYREDFAGAARMNKFALAFRIANNIVCGRCNSTGKDEYCFPKLAKSKENCDREDAYYDTNIEHQLDSFLPCLMRYSDETTLLCLMETPMGIPPPDKADVEDTTQPEDEPITTGSGVEGAGTGEDDAAGETEREQRVIPVRRQELVDIVSHAKITRVIIGEQLAGPATRRRRTLVHDKRP